MVTDRVWLDCGWGAMGAKRLQWLGVGGLLSLRVWMTCLFVLSRCAILLELFRDWVELSLSGRIVLNSVFGGFQDSPIKAIN